MRTCGALVVAAALLPVVACAGTDTTLGRQVMARADAPSVVKAGTARSAYVLHCAGCHQLDGSGMPQSYVPGLQRLGEYLRVPGGREFVIKVPGVMNSGLDDAQVAEVTNWVLGTLARSSVPEGQVPYEPAEVTRARATPLVDVMAERRRLLDEARRQGRSIQ